MSDAVVGLSQWVHCHGRGCEHTHDQVHPQTHCVLKAPTNPSGPPEGEDDFLGPAAQERYRVTPYRRGYLFRGPAGTGKAMLTLSIAGCFGLNIYAVTLSVGDSVSEDVVHRASWALHYSFGRRRRCRQVKAAQGMASLSALLDAIDGLRDGHIAIITTRHIERLDGALVQPGRVDVETELRLADRE
ncbi:hypothetical protein EDB81DRAFT_765672 [Dactylonectria macrodidyma]|uniref:ATPase AAA-type core domain-containing protein n=1 Tax=Dactylonectria macrodidyma TaxID=307937 RepID=A0A9P9DS57_9HYPO|nr:hypothetical protein EDB81DRAFT_765672 [Dactylonectria macrodidyma]